MEHTLHLAHPHTDRSVGILLNTCVNRHKGGGTVVLRPVELNTTTDPWTQQSYQCGLDDMIVIHEMAVGDLVVGHLHSTTQFWQYHHLDILVLQPNGLILLIDLLVAHRLDDGIGIDHPAATLIDSFLQEHRVLLRLPNSVGRDSHLFSPCFYHDMCVLGVSN